MLGAPTQESICHVAIVPTRPLATGTKAHPYSPREGDSFSKPCC